jgi:hypothetical protein
MNIKDISVPEVYKEESADFRFFLKWFDYALTKIQYDITNMMDLYDPLRCPKDLLWCLGDTMGYQYDDRLCAAFNRFAMLFFMSLIRYKGSKTGVTLAAEVNLKQKDINAYGEENQINYDRLDDTSIPVNSVYVESNVPDGCINVVYFTDEKPIDSCIEYVRPLGMYCFQYAGVRIDSMTKISIDARLANATDSLGSIGATRVGHYTRNDYARLQHMKNEPKRQNNLEDTRAKAWSRSSTTPAGSEPNQNAGYRALSSLQLANNEHIVKSLFSKPIFDLGYGPAVKVDTIIKADVKDPRYNLRYNRTVDIQSYGKEIDGGHWASYGQEVVDELGYLPVDTLDKDRDTTYTEGTPNPINPIPKVNGIMLEVGQRIIPSRPVGHITTEAGNQVDTEDGGHLTTE